MSATTGGHVYSRLEFEWRAADGSLALYSRGYRGGALPILRVVLDAKYPRMYRVSLPHGRLGDVANLTRAKDGAASLALAILNSDIRAAVASATEFEGDRVPDQPGVDQRISGDSTTF